MKMRKAPSLAIVMALVSGSAAVLPHDQNRSASERASGRPAEMLRQVADEVWQRRLGSPAMRLEQGLPISVDLPGQALAYKMGEIKLHELRERAQKNLGDKFDVRKFHQVVLGSGALPMAVLEQHVDWFIAEERK